MLTLAKVLSSEAAATYYEEADDYYAEGGRAPSAWCGGGAAALGLEGPVAGDDFKALLEGKLPGGQVMHRGGEGPRTAGLDLTFSAPKSLSMQALIGGDERLLRAHDEAVTKTLRHIEISLAAYRSTSGGETASARSGNITVARFEHDLSREADPQVHTHCVLLNVTRREDGEWRALDARPLYEQQKLLGTFYRAELARSVEALGIGIRRTHQDGRFELANITDQQVKAFSTRSGAINAALAARGQDRQTASAREREVASLSTRRSKDRSIDRAELRSIWMAKTADLDVDWTPVSPEIKSEVERHAAAVHSVDFAVAHLTERNAVVSRLKVAEVALAHGTGVLLLESVTREIDARIASGELLASDNGCQLTTVAAQALERDMLDIERRGRNALGYSIQTTDFAHSMLVGRRLTDGQRAAAKLVLTTRSRVVGVQGLAGTGKTTMLREVQRNLGPVFSAVGLAPSAAAARELEKSGIPSMTIAAFLARQGAGLDKNSVVVVDEAGMVSAKDMHAVLLAVDKANARAVLVGDTGQLKAIEAGIPFAQLQKAGMPTTRMADILRQANQKLHGAVLDAAEGRIAESIGKLKSAVAEVAHASTRYALIAHDYASLLPDDRERTLVVAGTNRARRSINELIRQRLGFAGADGRVTVEVLEKRDLTRAQLQSSLSYSPGDVIEALRHYQSIGLQRGDVVTVVNTSPGCITLRRTDGQEVEWRPTAMPHVAVHAIEEREVAIGDRLRFTANDYSAGIVNGQVGVVEAIDLERQKMTVRLGAAEVVELRIDAPLRLDHGYCSTVHAAQGQTCERVLVDADVSSAMANQSLFYVAISRARSQVALYTDDRKLLPEAMSRLDIKQAALDLQRPLSCGISM